MVMQPVRTDRARNSGYEAPRRKRSAGPSAAGPRPPTDPPIHARRGSRAAKAEQARLLAARTVEDQAAALERARRDGERERRSLEAGEVRDYGPQPGRCRVCGCTDDAACSGGCAWADETRTLCTRCAPAGTQAARRLEAPRLVVRVPFDELLDPADSPSLPMIRGVPLRLPADLVERFVVYCSRELLDMPIDSPARPMFELFLRALRDLSPDEADRLVREAARAWFKRAGVEVRT